MLNSDIEILAPCGSFEILKTAIKAGADACYIGGSRFGARAYADNLSDDQLEAAIDYAHIHGKKLYLTVNTLIKESELSSAYEYIKDCYEAGIDAFIVQDLGLFKLIRDNFPDVHIHCSTQMNITSYHAAAYMKKMGASRIVTAREMPLSEIKLIKDKVDVEVETFVHGAMCYSYSGQCLMSSLAGGRSGNRGRCAQPCRKCYDGDYILSMKDMCALELIPKLAKACIDSFKIEGRMKNEYYVASAVDAYKEMTLDYLNGSFSEKKAQKYKFRLANIYNRGGFCDGYFFMHNGPEMISKERPNNQGVAIGKLIKTYSGRVLISLSSDIYKGDVLELKLKNNENVEITSGNDEKAGKDIWLNAPKTKQIVLNQVVYRTRCNHILDEVAGIKPKDKIALSGLFTAKTGKPVSFEVKYFNDNKISEKIITASTVTVFGESIQKSNNKKIDKTVISEKLCQLNDTDYYFEELFIDADEDAFVPLGIIKKLRREALFMFENSVSKAFKRNIDDLQSFKECYKQKANSSNSLKTFEPKLKIGVKTIEQLKEVLKYPDIYGIYMNKRLMTVISDTEILSDIKQKGIKLYLELPFVVKGSYDFKAYTEGLDFEGIYIRNIDAFSSEIDYNKDIVLGAGLYAYNNISRDFLNERLSNAVYELPKELNLNELNDIDDRTSELCIYEYQQVMLSNNCIKKSRGMCNKTEEFITIKDDKANRFKVMSSCDECINVIYNGTPCLFFDMADIIDNCHSAYHRINFTVEDVLTVSKILNYYYDGIRPDMKFTTGHMFRGVE